MRIEFAQTALTSRAASRAAGWAPPIAAVAVGAYLRLYNLGEGGLGNHFYAAAVRSMTRSPHNFFFASFDPYGTFTVDKPPFALWLQSISALVLGYGGFALTLPQAIAGVIALAALYGVVRHTHGPFAALAAAFVFAVLPASVVVSRNNTMDTIVMALSVGAAALALRGVASGRLMPVCAAGVLLGLAFNTKGFEAFVAAPAIFAAFWLGSTLPVRRRLAHLAWSGVAMTVVGLSWVAAVSLFPASERPIVLNSDGNSFLNLTFGYNGIDRVLGGDGFNPANALTTTAEDVVPAGVFYGGKRGPLRVFGDFPGPLVAAALPLSLAGAALLLLDLRDSRRRHAAALWLPWLATGLAAFSASRLGSPHYLEAFSPAVAACAGIAIWEGVAGSGRRHLVALAGAAVSGGYALNRLTLLGDAGGLIQALAIVTIALAVLAAIILELKPAALPRAALFAPFAGVLAVLFAMSYQAVRDAPIEGVQPGSVLLTQDRSREVRFDPRSYTYSFMTGNYDYLDGTLSYLEARQRPGQYLVGVRSFYLSSSIIAKRDAEVLPLYSEFRRRPELPIERLRTLIDDGSVEYFMVSLTTLQTAFPEAAALIQLRCPMDISRQAGLAPQTGLQLYHCAPP